MAKPKTPAHKTGGARRVADDDKDEIEEIEQNSKRSPNQSTTSGRKRAPKAPQPKKQSKPKVESVLTSDKETSALIRNVELFFVNNPVVSATDEAKNEVFIKSVTIPVLQCVVEASKVKLNVRDMFDSLSNGSRDEEDETTDSEEMDDRNNRNRGRNTVVTTKKLLGTIGEKLTANATLTQQYPLISCSQVATRRVSGVQTSSTRTAAKTNHDIVQGLGKVISAIVDMCVNSDMKSLGKKTRRGSQRQEYETKMSCLHLYVLSPLYVLTKAGLRQLRHTALTAILSIGIQLMKRRNKDALQAELDQLQYYRVLIDDIITSISTHHRDVSPIIRTTAIEGIGTILSESITFLPLPGVDMDESLSSTDSENSDMSSSQKKRKASRKVRNNDDSGLVNTEDFDKYRVLSTELLKDIFLRYIGWGLSDKVISVRVVSVDSILKMYSKLPPVWDFSSSEDESSSDDEDGEYMTQKKCRKMLNNHVHNALRLFLSKFIKRIVCVTKESKDKLSEKDASEIHSYETLLLVGSTNNESKRHLEVYFGVGDSASKYSLKLMDRLMCLGIIRAKAISPKTPKKELGEENKLDRSNRKGTGKKSNNKDEKVESDDEDSEGQDRKQEVEEEEEEEEEEEGEELDSEYEKSGIENPIMLDDSDISVIVSLIFERNYKAGKLIHNLVSNTKLTGDVGRIGGVSDDFPKDPTSESLLYVCKVRSFLDNTIYNLLMKCKLASGLSGSSKHLRRPIVLAKLLPFVVDFLLHCKKAQVFMLDWDLYLSNNEAIRSIIERYNIEENSSSSSSFGRVNRVDKIGGGDLGSVASSSSVSSLHSLTLPITDAFMSQVFQFTVEECCTGRIGAVEMYYRCEASNALKNVGIATRSDGSSGRGKKEDDGAELVSLFSLLSPNKEQKGVASSAATSFGKPLEAIDNYVVRSAIEGLETVASNIINIALKNKFNTRVFVNLVTSVTRIVTNNNMYNSIEGKGGAAEKETTKMRNKTSVKRAKGKSNVEDTGAEETEERGAEEMTSTAQSGRAGNPLLRLIYTICETSLKDDRIEVFVAGLVLFNGLTNGCASDRLSSSVAVTPAIGTKKGGKGRDKIEEQNKILHPTNEIDINTKREMGVAISGILMEVLEDKRLGSIPDLIGGEDGINRLKTFGYEDVRSLLDVTRWEKFKALVTILDVNLEEPIDSTNNSIMNSLFRSVLDSCIVMFNKSVNAVILKELNKANMGGDKELALAFGATYKLVSSSLIPAFIRMESYERIKEEQRVMNAEETSDEEEEEEERTENREEGESSKHNGGSAKETEKEEEPNKRIRGTGTINGQNQTAKKLELIIPTLNTFVVRLIKQAKQAQQLQTEQPPNGITMEMMEEDVARLDVITEILSGAYKLLLIKEVEKTVVIHEDTIKSLVLLGISNLDEIQRHIEIITSGSVGGGKDKTKGRSALRSTILQDELDSITKTETSSEDEDTRGNSESTTHLVSWAKTLHVLRQQLFSVLLITCVRGGSVMNSAIPRVLSRAIIYTDTQADTIRTITKMAVGKRPLNAPNSSTSQEINQKAFNVKSQMTRRSKKNARKDISDDLRDSAEIRVARAAIAEIINGCNTVVEPAKQNKHQSSDNDATTANKEDEERDDKTTKTKATPKKVNHSHKFFLKCFSYLLDEICGSSNIFIDATHVEGPFLTLVDTYIKRLGRVIFEVASSSAVGVALGNSVMSKILCSLIGSTSRSLSLSSVLMLRTVVGGLLGIKEPDERQSKQDPVQPLVNHDCARLLLLYCTRDELTKRFMPEQSKAAHEIETGETSDSIEDELVDEDVRDIYKRLIADLVTSLRLVMVGKQPRPIDGLFIEGADKESGESDAETVTEESEEVSEGKAVTSSEADDVASLEISGRGKKSISSVLSRSESEKPSKITREVGKKRLQEEEPSGSTTQTDSSSGSIPDFDGFGAL